MTEQDNPFLVHVKDVCRGSSMIGGLILEALGPPDEWSEIYRKVEERGGWLDVRVVVEGREFTFARLDEALCKAEERATNAKARELVESRLDDLMEMVREAIEPVLDDFLGPDYDSDSDD